MKTMAALFLLLATLPASVAGADERLIPIDEFYLSVPVNDPPAEAGKREGLRVAVRVQRSEHEPQGGTKIMVSCLGFRNSIGPLETDEVAAFLEACAAATSGQEYRKEIRHSIHKFIYEVVTVDGQKRVSLRRGGEVLLAPEEGARLKESLALAAAAEAWYQMLLTARTLPVKTAAAHPPKAADFILNSKLGEVAVEGLGYEVSLTHDLRWQAEPYQVTHEVKYYSHGMAVSMSSGAWVLDMLTEVSHALRAVAKGQKFEATTTQGRRGVGFTVTANLETQRADMTYDGSFTGGLSHYQGSFSKEHLAAIEKLANSGEAWAYWFSQHEGWFFEKP